MSDGPRGPHRVGQGEAHGEATVGEVADDLGGQQGFAAEEGRQAGDVGEEAGGIARIFQADQGTETLTPLGQTLQRLAVGGTVIRLDQERVAGMNHAATVGPCGGLGCFTLTTMGRKRARESRIGFFPAALLPAAKHAGFSQGHADGNAQGPRLGRTGRDPGGAATGFTEHQRAILKLRSRDGDPLNGPIGKPNAQGTFHR